MGRVIEQAAMDSSGVASFVVTVGVSSRGAGVDSELHRMHVQWLSKLPRTRWTAARGELVVEYASQLPLERYMLAGQRADPPSAALLRDGLIELATVIERARAKLASKRGLNIEVLLDALRMAVANAPATDEELAVLARAERPQPPEVLFRRGAAVPFHDLRVYTSDTELLRVLEGATLPGGTYVTRAGFGAHQLAEAFRSELRAASLRVPGFDHIYIFFSPSSRDTARIVRRYPEPGHGVCGVDVGVAAQTLRAVCRGEAHAAGVDMLCAALYAVAAAFDLQRAPIDRARDAVLRAGAAVYAGGFAGYPPPLNRHR